MSVFHQWGAFAQATAQASADAARLERDALSDRRQALDDLETAIAAAASVPDVSPRAIAAAARLTIEALGWTIARTPDPVPDSGFRVAGDPK